MRVEKRRGGVEVSVTPALGWKTGLDNDYLYSEDTIWQLDRCQHIPGNLKAALVHAFFSAFLVSVIQKVLL